MSNKSNYLHCTIGLLLLLLMVARINSQEGYPSGSVWIGTKHGLLIKSGGILLRAETQRYDFQSPCLNSFTLAVYYCRNRSSEYCQANLQSVKNPNNKVEYSIRLARNKLDKTQLILRPVNIQDIDSSHF